MDRRKHFHGKEERKSGQKIKEERFSWGLNCQISLKEEEKTWQNKAILCRIMTEERINVRLKVEAL